MQRSFKLFAMLWLTFNTCAANSAELKIAFANHRPPYCFTENNIDKGIEVDLVRQIMSLSGHTVKVVIMPKVRHLKSLKDKEIDAATTVQNDYTDENLSLYYSDFYLEFRNIVISKSKDKISLNTIQDLKSYNFVIWQRAWKNLGPEFEAAYRPDSNGISPKNYNEAFNQYSQNKMFWANRVPLIIVDQSIFEHFKSILATEINTSEPVTYHDIFKTKTPYAVVFTDPILRQQFNEGLKKIRSNGVYQKILASYL
jgi:polar amino acid transport system substrate-binding protein